jgi:hypothetical protein
MQTNQKILLIGGPMDGYRRQMDAPIQNFAVYDRGYGNLSYDPMQPTVAIRTATYRVTQLIGADRQLRSVAVCTDVPYGTEVIDLLIKGYRGHRNKRSRKKDLRPYCV